MLSCCCGTYARDLGPNFGSIVPPKSNQLNTQVRRQLGDASLFGINRIAIEIRRVLGDLVLHTLLSHSFVISDASQHHNARVTFDVKQQQQQRGEVRTSLRLSCK